MPKAKLQSPDESWSKQRRFKHAVIAVVDHEWTQTEAAEYYGVSRQRLSPKVKAERVEREKKVQEAKAKVGAAPMPTGGRRELPETFAEFFDTYFTNWFCPDCRVTHEVPEFHEEIWSAITGNNRRVLINLPPYHSKSTLITVFHTVYELCRDPNTRTIIVSKSGTFAKAFLYSISQLLTNHELYADSKRNLIDDFGPFREEGSSQKWSQSEIYVANRTGAEKDPSVLAMGFGEQIYGRRADVIKFDDVATLENQRNPERVADMLEWIDKEALSRIGKSGKAIWVGTRVSAGDIYSRLMQRNSYKVIRYSALVDDAREEVLWPEHFPYEQVLIHRDEMKPADFQLIYQNVDIPGLGASFPPELIDEIKDTSRVIGHYETGWRLIAGLDPAGGTKTSGFTAFTLLGVDPNTGKRFLVDQYAERSMRSPQVRDKIIEWSTSYPIYEWRVETNGLQSQLIQYNEEIIRFLALRGIKVTPHITSSMGRTGRSAGKWDPQFGVESIAPLMHGGLFSLPWGNAPTAHAMQPLVEELIAFPMGELQDRVMSMWFAELGIRQVMERAHLPMFNDRMSVPKWVKRRRQVVDFNAREVRPVPLRDQYRGHMSRGQQDYRRLTLDSAVRHEEVTERPPPREEDPMNIDPNIWNP